MVLLATTLVVSYRICVKTIAMQWIYVFCFRVSTPTFLQAPNLVNFKNRLAANVTADFGSLMKIVHRESIFI